MIRTRVKTYKSARSFSRDAARMAAVGFVVVSTHQEPSKNKPLRNLLKTPVGGTVLWGSSIKGGKIVVTYQRAGQFGTPMASAVAPSVAVAPAPVRSFGQRLRRPFLVTVGVLVGVPVGLDVLAHLIH